MNDVVAFNVFNDDRDNTPTNESPPFNDLRVLFDNVPVNDVEAVSVRKNAEPFVSVPTNDNPAVNAF